MQYCSSVLSTGCCFPRRKNRHKRHGVGIVLPLPCRFAVVGFGVCRFARDRVDGPDPAAGCVQLPLFLLRELFIGDEFFHSASFRRLRLAACSGFIISQLSRGTGGRILRFAQNDRRTASCAVRQSALCIGTAKPLRRKYRT